MEITRMKLVGVFLGLVAFGGVLGTLFSGYGGFANAATPGYTGAQSAITMASGTADQAKQANAESSGADSVSKEDIQHYAELFEQNFASQLGVDTAKLDSSLRAALQATVDQAVADGKQDAARADGIKTKIGDLNFRDLVSIPLGMVGAGDKVNDLGNSQAFMDATSKAFDAGAQLLGITREEFESSLRDDSMATVLASKNVTFEALLTTMASTLRTELDKAVTAGTITQDQSDLMYNAFKDKFSMVLNGEPKTK